MAACANCSRELRPEWKFCVSCGMPTGVAAARPEAAAAPGVVGMPEPVVAAVAPVTPVGSTVVAAPVVAPTALISPPWPERATASASLSAPTRSSRSRPRPLRVNALAIVALVLGCVASPLAALFGHLALAQIAVTHERGRIPALIAVVLGYGALAFVVGLGLLYLTSRG